MPKAPLHPVLKSHGHAKSMKNLTLNEPKIKHYTRNQRKNLYTFIYINSS